VQYSPSQTTNQRIGHLWLSGGTIFKSFRPSWVLGPPAFPIRDYVATTASELNAAVAAGGTCIAYIEQATDLRYVWPVDIAREIARDFWFGAERQVALPLSRAEIELPPYVPSKPKRARKPKPPAPTTATPGQSLRAQDDRRYGWLFEKHGVRARQM
jgi:hypothetical protein